jgi:hypothetical protein
LFFGYNQNKSGRGYGSTATKIALIYSNYLIIQELSYLEGVVAHGRASSNLAFGTSYDKRALISGNTADQGSFFLLRYSRRQPVINQHGWDPAGQHRCFLFFIKDVLIDLTDHQRGINSLK